MAIGKPGESSPGAVLAETTGVGALIGGFYAAGKLDDYADWAEELTEFNLAQNGTAWWIPGGEWNRYEYLYEETPIDAVSLAHTPLTFRMENGTHVAIHEAALVDFAGIGMAGGLQRQNGAAM